MIWGSIPHNSTPQQTIKGTPIDPLKETLKVSPTTIPRTLEESLNL